MVYKFFEKHVKIEEKDSSRKPENLMELDYYLLESEFDEAENREISKAYGIEIVKRHNGGAVERKQFKNIFPSKEKTKNLIELLAEQTVTPLTLPYILDDLLGI